MLGVRRAGVTVALNALESKGVISLTRGQILITDREGLKASANGYSQAGNSRRPLELDASVAAIRGTARQMPFF